MKPRSRTFAAKILALTAVPVFFAQGPASAADQSFDPSGSILARWTFDQGSVDGSTVEDSGPNRFNGVLRSGNEAIPQIVDGIRGQGLNFQGPHQAWVELDRNLKLQPPFTIAAWVKLTARRGTMEVLGQKAHSWREGVRVVFSARQFFFEYSDGQENIVVRFDPHQTGLNQWVFLAVVHDGEEIALYVDGDEVKRDAARPGKWSSRPLLLGNYVGQKDDYRFLGVLDEVALFNEAFPAALVPSLGRWMLEGER